MVDIQPPTAEIRRGEKEERKIDINHRAKIKCPDLLYRAAIIMIIIMIIIIPITTMTN